jgi:hypothetical protein
VVSFPPATEEIGAMCREIESRQCVGWYFKEKKNGNFVCQKVAENGDHIVTPGSYSDPLKMVLGTFLCPRVTCTSGRRSSRYSISNIN